MVSKIDLSKKSKNATNDWNLGFQLPADSSDDNNGLGGNFGFDNTNNNPFGDDKKESPLKIGDTERSRDNSVKLAETTKPQLATLVVPHQHLS